MIDHFHCNNKSVSQDEDLSPGTKKKMQKPCFTAVRKKKSLIIGSAYLTSLSSVNGRLPNI